MTVEERVVEFLAAHQGKAYCVDCLAEEIRASRDQVRDAVTGLSASGRFRREFGRCAKRIHGKDRKVIGTIVA